MQGEDPYSYDLIIGLNTIRRRQLARKVPSFFTKPDTDMQSADDSEVTASEDENTTKEKENSQKNSGKETVNDTCPPTIVSKPCQ
jgi:hypothetical protein